jgi:phospholipase/carboxylesterase
VAGAGLDLLAHRLRAARVEPAGALVLLHGRGVDESDLYPLLDALDPDARLLGATPRAPLTLPPGGHHWYIVERVGYPHRETFMESYELLTEWLGALAEEGGVPWERTVIGGFSQGAVMAYALALAKGRPAPAGLLAMSGFIPEVEGFELDLERPGLPIAITHGTLDPIIGIEFGRSARQRLEAAGNRILYRESPVGHGIDPAVLPGLREWLRAAVDLAGQSR